MASKVRMTWRGHRLVQQVRAGAQSGAQRAADLFIEEARRLIIETPKSGVIYYRGALGWRQASAPGEPPANLTGLLANSFKINTSRTGTVVTVSITNTAPYAQFLEFGTRKMEPRPFMRAAYANVKDRMVQVIRGEIQKKVT